MNRLIKNMFMVIVIALLLSLAMTTISKASRLVTSEVTYADSNEPGDIPEMTPNYLNLNVIAEDPNEPGNIPEMVPGSSAFRVPSTQYYELSTNFISADPNEEPAEMVISR